MLKLPNFRNKFGQYILLILVTRDVQKSYSACYILFNDIVVTGFIQTMESPGIKMLRFPGLESPGKRHRSWKTLEKSWNSKVVVLEILISGTSIAN